MYIRIYFVKLHKKKNSEQSNKLLTMKKKTTLLENFMHFNNVYLLEIVYNSNNHSFQASLSVFLSL